MDNKIIDRVRKLLSRSKSDNEHEAAIAAGHAARLMAEHNLTEAQLRVEDSSRAAESITTLSAEGMRRRVAWIECVRSAVADSLGLKSYFSYRDNKTFDVVFGRESATQTWNYTSQYLIREIERLADEAWARDGAGSARRWKNAFRMGAAYAVAARLASEIRKTRTAQREMAEAADRDLMRTSDQPTTVALALVEKDEDEVRAAYKEHSRSFGRAAASIGNVSSISGYYAGKDAGESIALGGGRAALPAGQGRLT